MPSTTPSTASSPGLIWNKRAHAKNAKSAKDAKLTFFALFAFFAIFA